jgi:hypothetical protein
MKLIEFQRWGGGETFLNPRDVVAIECSLESLGSSGFYDCATVTLRNGHKLKLKNDKGIVASKLLRALDGE